MLICRIMFRKLFKERKCSETNEETSIISTRIIQPVTRCRWHNAILHIIARLLIGEPEGVVLIGICFGKGFCWSVKPLIFKNLNEGEIHVDVIIVARRFIVSILQISVIPVNFHGIWNHGTIEFEFNRAAISHTNSLCSPCAFDLVQQIYFGYGYTIRLL